MNKIAFFCLVLIAYFPMTVSGLENMSNEDLSSITGQAVTDNPAFNLPEVTAPSTTVDQFLTSFSQSNSPVGSSGAYQTVAVDFIGKQTTDEFGNTFRENYYATALVENCYYEGVLYAPGNSMNFTSGLYTQFVFDGMLKGKVVVPEYFDNNPELRSKQVYISQDRIDLPSGATGNYICSYQGNIYESGLVPESDSSFPIYPNRQTITVGTAKGGDLMILLPRGTGLDTVWRPVVKNTNAATSELEYLVIPEGKDFIHIGLNHMVSRIDMSFTVRFSQSKEKLKELEKNILTPPDIGQTLGTLTMVGGETRINGGDLIITINDSL